MQLLLGLGLHLLRHFGLGNLLFQLLDLGDLDVELAQFALHGPDLLAQKELALGTVNLLLNLVMDAVLQLQHVELFGQENAEPLQPGRRFQGLQQFLPFREFQFQEGGDQIRQWPRFGGVHRRHVGILRQRMRQLHHFFEQGQHGTHQGLGAQ